VLPVSGQLLAVQQLDPLQAQELFPDRQLPEVPEQRQERRLARQLGLRAAEQVERRLERAHSLEAQQLPEALERLRERQGPPPARAARQLELQAREQEPVSRLCP
jgi:hypothetical protein